MTNQESAICLAHKYFSRPLVPYKNKDRQGKVRLFSSALINAQVSHSSGTFYSRLPGDYGRINLIFPIDDHHLP